MSQRSLFWMGNRVVLWVTSSQQSNQDHPSNPRGEAELRIYTAKRFCATLQWIHCSSEGCFPGQEEGSVNRCQWQMRCV